MTQNMQLQQLSEQGVAVWLDDLSRDRLQSGGLAKLIAEKSVVGVTTNPSIFEAAISKSDLYGVQIHDSAVLGLSVDETVRSITTRDVRSACDVFAPTFNDSNQLDGRVSIEVDPRSAKDTEKTIAEAKLLWWMVDRPNLFIKIPSTVAGLDAITAVIAEGISVNVTLMFSIDRYKAVMDAFMKGLENRLAAGDSIDSIASVASFFVSRVDVEIDSRLTAIGTDESAALLGKAGVANAVLAYKAYEEVVASDRWRKLAKQGAKPQRPLWASTGVKNPDYKDTLYISDLVAPGTVNTIPEKTMDAYADHGELGTPIVDAYATAEVTMADLKKIGIDYDDVVKVLEDEGVAKFEKAWAELLGSVKDELQK